MLWLSIDRRKNGERGQRLRGGETNNPYTIPFKSPILTNWCTGFEDHGPEWSKIEPGKLQHPLRFNQGVSKRGWDCSAFHHPTDQTTFGMLLPTNAMACNPCSRWGASAWRMAIWVDGKILTLTTPLTFTAHRLEMLLHNMLIGDTLAIQNVSKGISYDCILPEVNSYAVLICVMN